MPSPDEIIERYVALLGKEPSRLPDDHPDAWQWDYRGTKDEREELIERLGLHEPVVEQDALFE